MYDCIGAIALIFENFALQICKRGFKLYYLIDDD